ncbi:MAG: response regulator transcription factor [Armatimonadetes bacterium]|nr:response regulator transcription factor [Armatimonadota bacterium]
MRYEVSDRIRVLIVDDQKLFAHMLAEMLQGEEGIEVAGIAGDGEETLRQAEALAPDLILLDLELPGMDGIRVISEVGKRFPSVRILVLTGHIRDSLVLDAVRAGAFGYLLKGTVPERVVDAIRQVHRGEFPVDPRANLSIRRALLEARSARASSPVTERTEKDAPPLTERELAIIQRLAEGKSNKEIGSALALSENTVKAHISRILQKLRLRDRVQLLLYAREHQWV